MRLCIGPAVQLANGDRLCIGLALNSRSTEILPDSYAGRTQRVQRSLLFIIYNNNNNINAFHLMMS